MCFCPFVLLAVGFLLRQAAFPVKMVSLCENEKTFSGEFCVSLWDSRVPKVLYSVLIPSPATLGSPLCVLNQ